MHVPAFCNRQVLVKWAPPENGVSSGMVTSATKAALSMQPSSPGVGEGVTAVAVGVGVEVGGVSVVGTVGSTVGVAVSESASGETTASSGDGAATGKLHPEIKIASARIELRGRKYFDFIDFSPSRFGLL